MGGIYNTVNFHLYHYAGNNPVKYIDPDGRNIALLNRSYGAGGFGHNAVMIGNDEEGWILYSKDDTNKNTRKEYTTFASFLEDNYKADYKDRYDKYAYLKTSKSDDKEMQKEGDMIYNREYALSENTNNDGTVKQNCADLVADIISKAKNVLIAKPKIEKGDKTRSGPYIWHFFNFDIIFKEGDIKSPIDTSITHPNLQYKWFIYDNQIIGGELVY